MTATNVITIDYLTNADLEDIIRDLKSLRGVLGLTTEYIAGCVGVQVGVLNQYFDLKSESGSVARDRIPAVIQHGLLTLRDELFNHYKARIQGHVLQLGFKFATAMAKEEA